MPNVSIVPCDSASGLDLDSLDSLDSAGYHGDEDEHYKDVHSSGTSHGKNGAAGSKDIVEPEPCYTSAPHPRPDQGGTQVVSHEHTEATVPMPLLEPVEFDFSKAGVPMNPAGTFGGKYSLRDRNKIMSNTVTSNTPFLGYIQVQKDTLFVEPSTYFEAINSPEAEKWLAAMQDEMNSLSALGTWTYVEVTEREREEESHSSKMGLQNQTH